MKNILLNFVVLVAFFFLLPPPIHSVTPTLRTVNAVQLQISSNHNTDNKDTDYFDCIEDVSDDNFEDENDAPAHIINSTTPFSTLNFPKSYFLKIHSAKNLFLCSLPLFIFLCVFRI